MQYASFLRESACDGDGIRLIAYLQGCDILCKNCQNPELQPPNGGIKASNQKFAELILSQLTPLHRGIVFQGGEPLFQHQQLHHVCKILKKYGVNIWLYSGHCWEQVKDYPIFKHVDVLVDGPFIETQRTREMAFVGSKNQRIIDVQKSLKEGKMVEYKLKEWWE